MPQIDKVVILTGDYPQRLDALFAAAVEASEDNSPRTIAEGDPYRTLSEEYADLKAEAEAAGTVVTLSAVARPVWRDLKAKHPPRVVSEDVAQEVADGDRAAGVNSQTVEDDLVAASVVSVVEAGAEVAVSTRQDFDTWANTLSEGEWQTVLVRAWRLATGARFDPKSLPVSRTTSTA